ncbi:dephospho-CoA kinase [Marinicellulosiphila megalodicopiae]|uniref:dephospho-CoA kinase n=1 Tax=Marinicellulosiphila megalodicopiae TaxID=2724896 RepID=UPI003BAFB4FD
MIIGLTGGIASGKSTACSILQDLNIPIVDADIIARQITEPNHPILQKLAESFGDDILINGTLDRSILRQKAFASSKNIKLLNSITHPAIHQLILSALANSKTNQYTVLCAPLLFENNLDKLCDITWLIDADPELQVARIMQRDQCDEQTAYNIVNSQLPSQEKRLRADIIIRNNAILNDFKQSILNQHTHILKGLSHDQN